VIAGLQRTVGARTRLPAFAGAFLAVVLAVAVIACGGGQAGSAPGSHSSTGPVVLTVVGETGQKQFTMSQLQALPACTGYGGMKSSTGVITLPAKYTGVRLSDLAALVGGISPANGVTVVAKDGYGMTLAYDQIMQHRFTAYDPATGAEVTPAKDLTVVIAYAREGKPLDPDDGPLRLVVTEAKPGGQVIDGHWSVKWIDRVSVTKASAQWKVQLQGALSGKLDKSSYVNCASPGCHGSGWVDAAGERWEGVPLYLVAGTVDDAKRHGAGAYNARLARKGYEIQIESADGKVVTIDSRLIAGKDSIVLAGKVNGGELPEEWFPLRLVGPGLSKVQMPGRIARIVVRPK
jgi:DMSO/TMAO reductase YedYZ molybdopterin-dependent catalytic subunit